MSQDRPPTIQQIREAKRLLNAFEITEGAPGTMTLEKMLAIVQRMDAGTQAADVAVENELRRHSTR